MSDHYVEKLTDEQEATIAAAVAAFGAAIKPVHDDIIEILRYRVEQGLLDLSDGAAVRETIQMVFEQYQRAIDFAVTSMHENGANIGRTRVLTEYELDIAPTITDPAHLAVIQDNGQRASELIRKRMHGDISTAIIRAYEADLPVAEITSILQNDVFPPMREYEAHRIALTEVMSGVSEGELSAYEESTSVFGKEWVAVLDGHTRPTHIIAAGQIVPKHEHFAVGGFEAYAPRDMDLPARERANCRCHTEPVFDPPEEGGGEE